MFRLQWWSHLYDKVIKLDKLDFNNIRLVMREEKTSPRIFWTGFLRGEKKSDCAVILAIDESRYKRENYSYKIGLKSLDSQFTMPNGINLSHSKESYYTSDLRLILDEINKDDDKICDFGFYKTSNLAELKKKHIINNENSIYLSFFNIGQLFSMPKVGTDNRLESLFVVCRVDPDGVLYMELSSTDRSIKRITLSEINEKSEDINIFSKMEYSAVVNEKYDEHKEKPASAKKSLNDSDSNYHSINNAIVLAELLDEDSDEIRNSRGSGGSIIDYSANKTGSSGSSGSSGDDSGGSSSSGGCSSGGCD